MDIPICPKHGLPMKLRPAGISKTGKAYPAFWACGERNPDGSFCREKPQIQVPTAGRQVAEAQFKEELNQNIVRSDIKEMHNEKTENIARAVALNDATEFFKEASGRWARFSDYDECVVALFKLADDMVAWLKNERGTK